MNSYSIDFSANQIVNTISNATTANVKCDQTDGKDHPDCSVPLHYVEGHYDDGISFHIPEIEPIIITSDAVFIKPLKLVVLTEDVYNKLKGEDDETDRC